MAKNKTLETQESVTEFLATVADEKKRNESLALVEIFEKHTGLPAKMWGPSIIGFGTYHYKYASGHEGEAPLVGFSPRANAISLYLTNAKANPDVLEQLGKYKMGGGCVYIKKVEDIDVTILNKLIDISIEYLKSTYPN